jgi:hypothetical protein
VESVLNPKGSVHHLLLQSVMLVSVFVSFVWFSLKAAAIISLNSVNQLIFVMVKCVLFEVRTGFLNKI